MEGFFFILIGFLIVIANVIGFVFYKKRKIYIMLLLSFYYWQVYLVD